MIRRAARSTGAPDQLGLRGETLARYAREWIVSIEDISAFVAEQRGKSDLRVPVERVYPVRDSATARRLAVTPA